MVSRNASQNAQDITCWDDWADQQQSQEQESDVHRLTETGHSKTKRKEIIDLLLFLKHIITQTEKGIT